jgi:TRAP-type C4-dicarboxylate transport system substrate-binding protein
MTSFCRQAKTETAAQFVMNFRIQSPALRNVLALLLATAVAAAASAAPKLKLGTLVPVGTSYHKILMTLGETWRKDSAGAADINIFAGGKLGGEGEMVGLMQLNSLQVALLSGVGLAEIEPGVTGLQNIPMGFRSLDEVDYVGSQLQPMLEKRMLAKGFVVLCWVDSGWVRFFSSKPMLRPDDMRQLKLFNWAGNPGQIELYQAAGFKAQSRETADIVPGLQSGLIDAVPLPPFFAMASQVDTRAPYMLELNWAPLVGALVIRRATWEKFPEEMRAKLLASAMKSGEEITSTARREMEDSVKAMEKRGLKVTHVSPEVAAEWREMSEKVYPIIRGKMIPADIFDETLRVLAEYRKKKAP